MILHLSLFTIVHLENNILSGTIPPLIFALPYIDLIDMSDNILSGSIPSDVLNGSVLNHCKFTLQLHIV